MLGLRSPGPLRGTQSSRGPPLIVGLAQCLELPRLFHEIWLSILAEWYQIFIRYLRVIKRIFVDLHPLTSQVWKCWMHPWFICHLQLLFSQLYMHVSDQRESSLIAVDFISPNLISSGVFPSRLQIDPASFQEGRRPIKPVATCGRGSCSRSFFCESRSSSGDLSFHLLLFLSFHMSNEDSALFYLRSRFCLHFLLPFR